MNNSYIHSSKIKEKAVKLLKSKMIIEHLEPYGSVNLTGSYELDLMTWHDIDMQIKLNQDLQAIDVFTGLSKIFLKDPDLHCVKLLNFLPEKNREMPIGVCMVLEYRLLGSKETWKLDIWALEEPELNKNIQFMNNIKKKLTPELRDLILTWKFKMVEQYGKVPKGGSYWVYQGVLFEGLRAEKDILDYLRDKGVKI